MNQTAVDKNHGAKSDSRFVSTQEMALLGGLTPALNQTRVMAANRRSRFVRPADLDAFLQGYLGIQ